MLTDDIRESWAIFAMAASRERGKDANGNEWEQFSVKWEFVNTYLTHAEIEDKEQVLHDLVDLTRAMNT